MSVEMFESVLREQLQREPFEPFVVELLDGERLVVPHRNVAFGGGGAAFFSPSNDIIEFVCENVRSIMPFKQGAAA